MGLKPHGPRVLSHLEKVAVNLVFWEYTKQNRDKEKIFDKVRISIVPEIVFATGEEAGGSYGGNEIKIAIDKHPCTDNLDHTSTLQNTDILKPGNMQYLNTFIHECTHHWQTHNNRYPVSYGGYDFTKDDLIFWNLDKEGHASAAATWFILGWQLKYVYGDEVNLTTSFLGRLVGKVDRYDKIKEIPHKNGYRWVSMLDAIEIARDFLGLLNDLRGQVEEIEEN